MDPKFWYQQHKLDSDAHHLNRHVIDVVQKYIRGDATLMETYIELGASIQTPIMQGNFYAAIADTQCYSIYAC
jgi:hypothetical protein